MAEIAYALPATDKLFDGLLSGLKRFTEDLNSGTTDSGGVGYRWRQPLPPSPRWDAGAAVLRPVPALHAKLRPEEASVPRTPSRPPSRPRSRPGAKPRSPSAGPQQPAARPAPEQPLPQPPSRQRSPRPPPAARNAGFLAAYGPPTPQAPAPPRPAPNPARLSLCIPRAFQRSLSLEPLSARSAPTAEPLLEPARLAALRAGAPNSARGPGLPSPAPVPRAVAPPVASAGDLSRPLLRASPSAPKHRSLEEHIARVSAKLLRAAGSPKLAWCTADSEADYRSLQPEDYFNHFQNNRALTTKAGLAQTLAQYAVASGEDVESFFPRSYDMAQRSEREDFVLDFRRSASVRIAALHLRLQGQLDRGAGARRYCCNLDVLRVAERTLQRWCCDLDPEHLDEEAGSEARRAGVPEDSWDALVLYSELTAAQLCGEEDEDLSPARAPRRRYHRVGGGELADPAEGGSAPPAAPGPRSADVRCWPEFRGQRWDKAPPERSEALRELLERLERLFPQFALQGGENGGNVWVAKPGNSSKGSGVECHSSLPELLRHCDAMTDRVVQKYIERPLLLCGGRKFDLRQWVLVTSVAPLRAFVFSECYLRLCNGVYDLGALRDRERHLCNWQVNKNGRHVVEGAVQSLPELQRELAARTGRSDVWELQLVPQLHGLVLQTLRAAEGQLVPRERSFELYGFDVLLDEDLRLWLLEVNLSPGCEGRAPFLERLLERMSQRLVEVAVLGQEEPDGQLPDWLPLEGLPEDDAAARAAAEAARRPAPDRPVATGLVLHGQAVSIPKRRPPRPSSGRRAPGAGRPPPPPEAEAAAAAEAPAQEEAPAREAQRAEEPQRQPPPEQWQQPLQSQQHQQPPQPRQPRPQQPPPPPQEPKLQQQPELRELQPQPQLQPQVQQQPRQQPQQPQQPQQHPLASRSTPSLSSLPPPSEPRLWGRVLTDSSSAQDAAGSSVPSFGAREPLSPSASRDRLGQALGSIASQEGPASSLRSGGQPAQGPSCEATLVEEDSSAAGASAIGGSHGSPPLVVAGGGGDSAQPVAASRGSDSAQPVVASRGSPATRAEEAEAALALAAEVARAVRAGESPRPWTGAAEPPPGAAEPRARSAPGRQEVEREAARPAGIGSRGAASTGSPARSPFSAEDGTDAAYDELAYRVAVSSTLDGWRPSTNGATPGTRCPQVLNLDLMRSPSGLTEASSVPSQAEGGSAAAQMAEQEAPLLGRGVGASEPLGEERPGVGSRPGPDNRSSATGAATEDEAGQAADLALEAGLAAELADPGWEDVASDACKGSAASEADAAGPQQAGARSEEAGSEAGGGGGGDGSAAGSEPGDLAESAAAGPPPTGLRGAGAVGAAMEAEEEEGGGGAEADAVRPQEFDGQTEEGWSEAGEGERGEESVAGSEAAVLAEPVEEVASLVGLSGAGADDGAREAEEEGTGAEARSQSSYEGASEAGAGSRASSRRGSRTGDGDDAASYTEAYSEAGSEAESSDDASDSEGSGREGSRPASASARSSLQASPAASRPGSASVRSSAQASSQGSPPSSRPGSAGAKPTQAEKSDVAYSDDEDFDEDYEDDAEGESSVDSEL